MHWFWQKKRIISGDVVDLRCISTSMPSERTSWTKTIYYSIVRHDTDTVVGECDLRVGMNDEIYYAGNIGYRVYQEYRGHGYAYWACLLLLKEAKQTYDMEEVIITCTPDNIASRKTIEKLGGQLVETVDVPNDHWLYLRGETVKNIYRFEL